MQTFEWYWMHLMFVWRFYGVEAVHCIGEVTDV